MKHPRHPLSSHQEAIEAMAAAWLAQRDEGLSADEAADFERWQRADPQHAAAVARLERTWSALQQLREFRPESHVHPDPDLLAGARPAARIISFPTAAVAGLAAAAAIAVLVWWPRPTDTAPAATPDQPVYATTAGGYQRVTLDDGSVLELNADSLVRVAYTPAERRVQLERGEGHFTVAKNPQRPFFVVAGKVAVRAVGTAFNVRLTGDEIEVIVTEGRVRVENQAAGIPMPAAAAELGLGQRLVLSTVSGVGSATVRPEDLAPETVHQALAWQGPRLRFVDTPLSGVVSQFNRHNRVQIELADDSLASIPVDGSLRAENVEALLHLLEADPSIAVERVGADRIVLRRAR